MECRLTDRAALRLIILLLVVCYLTACRKSDIVQLAPTPQAATTRPIASQVATEPLNTPTPPVVIAPITTNITPTMTFLPRRVISTIAFADQQHGWMAQRVITEHTVTYETIAQEFHLLATTDGGRTWSRLPDPPFAIEALDFVSPTRGWATIQQRLYETSDGGQSWSPAPSANALPDRAWLRQPGATHPCEMEEDYPAQVSFPTSQDGWMVCVGQPGTGFQSKHLFTSRDGGITWQLVADSAGTVPDTDLPAFGYASDLQAIDAQYAWMQVERVGVALTRDGGRTWVNSPGMVANNPMVSAIAPVTPEHGFAVINGHTLIETTDGAQTWQQIYPAPYPHGPIFFSDTNHGIGTGTLLDGSAMFRTSDGGATWTPAVLTDAELRALHRRMGGMARPDPVWYTGTIAWKEDDYTNSFMRSVDDGQHWQTIDLSRHVTSLSTSPKGVVWVTAYARVGGADGENSGRLLRSADGGATWTEYHLGSRFTHIQVCFVDSQHGWLRGGTHIYRTLDGGNSWTQLH